MGFTVGFGMKNSCGAAGYTVLGFGMKNSCGAAGIHELLGLVWVLVCRSRGVNI